MQNGGWLARSNEDADALGRNLISSVTLDGVALLVARTVLSLHVGPLKHSSCLSSRLPCSSTLCTCDCMYLRVVLSATLELLDPQDCGYNSAAARWSHHRASHSAKSIVLLWPDFDLRPKIWQHTGQSAPDGTRLCLSLSVSSYFWDSQSPAEGLSSGR